MRIVIILLNWKNASDTIHAVESLLTSEHENNYSVVVCDNASNDGSEEAFLRWTAAHPELAAPFLVSEKDTDDRIRQAFSFRVVWVATGANLGFAGGNNVGVRLAQLAGAYDYFWFLNNDCTVESNTLNALVAHMQADPSIGICGAKVHYHDPSTKVQAYGGAVHNVWTGRAQYIGHMAHVDQPHSAAQVEEQMNYVCGASMFVRKAFIDRIGLMAEDYFLYFEELDWATRAKGVFRLGYCPDAIVHHKEGATVGSSSDTRKTSRLSDFYMFRNRLRFTARFYPWALPSVWLVMLLQALKRGARGQRDRMWLIIQILFGKAAL